MPFIQRSLQLFATLYHHQRITQRLPRVLAFVLPAALILGFALFSTVNNRVLIPGCEASLLEKYEDFHAMLGTHESARETDDFDRLKKKYCVLPALDSEAMLTVDRQRDYAAVLLALKEQRWANYIPLYLSDVFIILCYFSFFYIFFRYVSHQSRTVNFSILGALVVFDVLENLFILALYIDPAKYWPFKVLGFITPLKYLAFGLALLRVLWPMKRNIVAARFPLIFLAIFLAFGFVSYPDGSIANALKTNPARLNPFWVGFIIYCVGTALLFFFLHAWNLGVEQLNGEKINRFRIRYISDFELAAAQEHVRRRIGESLFRCVCVLLVAYPILSNVGKLSLSEYSQSFSIVSYCFGIAAAFCVMFAIEFSRMKLLAVFNSWPSIVGLFDRLGPGFTQEQSGKPVLLPGHDLSLVVFVVIFTIYVVGGFLGAESEVATVEWWPTITYLLLWMTMLCAIFTALSFVCDRWRLPVMLIFFGWLVLTGGIRHTTHYFNTEYVAEDTRPTIAEYLDEFSGFRIANHAHAPQVYSVVAATGGGIQAAAWTAQGFEEFMQVQGFDESLSLISSTSGGSVGSWMYLESQLPCDEKQASPCDHQREQKLFEAASSSSLAATMYGLVYPDFIRTFLPLFANTDRATLMEDSWMLNCAQQGVCLPAYEKAPNNEFILPRCNGEKGCTFEGTKFVFNSTRVEDGYPYLISNLYLDELLPVDDFQVLHRERRCLVSGSGEPSLTISKHGTLQEDAACFAQRSAPAAQPLARRYDDKKVWYQPARVTAARLSATFPFITPNAAPRLCEKVSATGECSEQQNLEGVDTAWHAIDGGTLDNSGVFTALNFIQRIIDVKMEEPKRVVLLRLNAFASATYEENLCSYSTFIREQEINGDVKTIDRCIPTFVLESKLSGTTASMFGPMIAGLKVWSSGQFLRVSERIANVADEVDAVSLAQHTNLDSRTDFCVVDFSPVKSFISPPLSWQLSNKNKRFIENSWKSKENQRKLRFYRDVLSEKPACAIENYRRYCVSSLSPAAFEAPCAPTQ